MSIENAYSIIKDKFGNKLDLEPFPIIESVDKHRKFWKPKKVRVLLLAESHVYTLFNEYDTCLNYDGFSQLDGCPTNYVRLVYCLGYGENNLIRLDNNKGTPPYWKIFASCLYGNNKTEFAKLQSTKTPNFKQRLKNKMLLLEKLKENGIWLLDASIVALYKKGRIKPTPKTMHDVISTCWDLYVFHMINEMNPEKIIVVGNDVLKPLTLKLNKMNIDFDFQKQPNAYMKKEEIPEYFNRFHELCKN